MKATVFISVDPGATGAICLLDPKNKQVAFVATTIPPKEIMDWFQRVRSTYVVQMVMIEKVHAIFGTSAGSNFSFGYNTGVVNALAEASGFGVAHVTPKTWQKLIGVTKRGKAIKKEVAMIMAKMYPDAELHGPRGGLLDGRSDALAIAHYAAVKFSF